MIFVFGSLDSEVVSTRIINTKLEGMVRDRNVSLWHRPDINNNYN